MIMQIFVVFWKCNSESLKKSPWLPCMRLETWQKLFYKSKGPTLTKVAAKEIL